MTARTPIQQPRLALSPLILRLLADTRSHVLALVDTTDPLWEEVPVLAGCGLVRANVDGGLWRMSRLSWKFVCAGGPGCDGYTVAAVVASSVDV